MRSTSRAKPFHIGVPPARAARATATHDSTNELQSKRVSDSVSGSVTSPSPRRRYASRRCASYGVPTASSPTRAVARPSGTVRSASWAVRSAAVQPSKRARSGSRSGAPKRGVRFPAPWNIGAGMARAAARYATSPIMARRETGVLMNSSFARDGAHVVACEGMMLPDSALLR